MQDTLQRYPLVVSWRLALREGLGEGLPAPALQRDRSFRYRLYIRVVLHSSRTNLDHARPSRMAPSRLPQRQRPGCQCAALLRSRFTRPSAARDGVSSRQVRRAIATAASCHSDPAVSCLAFPLRPHARIRSLGTQANEQASGALTSNSRCSSFTSTDTESPSLSWASLTPPFARSVQSVLREEGQSLARSPRNWRRANQRLQKQQSAASTTG